MTQKIPTSSLLQRLLRTRSIKSFIKTYDEQLGTVPLAEYLGRLCTQKDAVTGHVIKKSGIDRTYGYQIFNGTKQNPSRDIIIALAFGFEMSYDETQELLKAAGKNALYARVERDAVLIFALNKKYGIDEVQVALKELDLPLLGKEDRHE